MVRANRIESHRDFADILDGLGEPSLEPNFSRDRPSEHLIVPTDALQSKQWLLDLLDSVIRRPTTIAVVPECKTPFHYAEDFSDSHFQAEDPKEDLKEDLGIEIANCDPDAIAKELGLHSDLNSDELKRIRRNFALRNHPDRLDPANRARATQRMTIANMLIDQLLKQKKKG
jgi:hypothetical protein